MTLAGTGCQLG